MSFSSQWLALREPVDLRARNKGVLAAVQSHFSGRASLAVTDLASGTGSTFRAVHPALWGEQIWTLVDHDAKLLAEARRLNLAHKSRIRTRQVDLSADIVAGLAGPCDFLTTSAFLDLVSEAWLDQLIQVLKLRRLPFYAALSYDGRSNSFPPHPADADILAVANKHQLIDKGLGAALGPDSGDIAIAKLEEAGFFVINGLSDWEFTPEEGLVQTMLVSGWAEAAREMQSAGKSALSLESIEDWRDWRLTRIAEGASRISVGHVDLFATP